MRALIWVMGIYACTANDFASFERILTKKNDGYESVWSTQDIECGVDAYTVTDTALQRFLGIDEVYPYVLLTLKDNATSFDTHVWEPEEWNVVAPTGADASVSEQIETLRSIKDTIPPKIWKQPSGRHDELYLEYAPETMQGPNISFTLYFTNATESMHMADIMHVVAAKYPVHMYCWDLMISDGPQPFSYVPTVAVHNEAVHGNVLKELQQPFTTELFDEFVAANLEMQYANQALARQLASEET